MRIKLVEVSKVGVFLESNFGPVAHKERIMAIDQMPLCLTIFDNKITIFLLEFET